MSDFPRLHIPDDDTPPGEIPKAERDAMAAQIREDREGKRPHSDVEKSSARLAVRALKVHRTQQSEWHGRIARDAEWGE